jgi:hypothetical protein
MKEARNGAAAAAVLTKSVTRAMSENIVFRDPPHQTLAKGRLLRHAAISAPLTNQPRSQ